MVSPSTSAKNVSLISPPKSPELLLREYAHGGDKNLEKIQDLFTHAIDIDASGSDTKKTALHRAVQSGAVKVCEFLLEKNASVNVFDRDSKTPLDIAIETKNFKIISIFCTQNTERKHSDLINRFIQYELNNISNTEIRNFKENLIFGDKLIASAKKAFPKDIYDIDIAKHETINSDKIALENKLNSYLSSKFEGNEGLMNVYYNLKSALELNFRLGTCGLRCYAAVAAYLTNREQQNQPRTVLMFLEHNNNENHAIILLGESYHLKNETVEKKFRAGKLCQFPIETIGLFTSLSNVLVVNLFRNEFEIASDYFKCFSNKNPPRITTLFDSVYTGHAKEDLPIIKEIIDCYKDLLK